MPGCYVLHKDSTKAVNFIDLIKGNVATATATVSQAYANADAYPNAQNWSCQQLAVGSVFVGEGIQTPTATNNSTILGPTGTIAKEASVNSLALISINFGVSANNTTYALSWGYT